MNTAEALSLLGTCSAFDNRKSENPAQAKVQAAAWAEALQPTMPLAWAKRAVVQHYAATRDWIMPSDLNSLWEAERRTRIAAVPIADYPDYPPDLDGPEYLRFRRGFVDAIGAGADRATAERAAWTAIGRPLPKPEDTLSIGDTQ